MKKPLVWLIASATLLGSAGAAFAADMPVKAPVNKAPVPVYGWSGFYIGGNVGYGWDDTHTDLVASGTNISFPGVIPITNQLAFTDPHSQSLSGVIGGGQFGYNYQFNPRWVIGFETDIQASGQRGSNTSTVQFSGAFCTGAVNPPPTCFLTTPFNATAVTAYEAKIDWFGTVRGRLGFLANDQFLIYGTGGLAYGQVSASGITSVNGSTTTFGPFATPGTGAFSASATRAGYTVGGGVEGKFALNWTWKLEYLYVNLGSVGAVGSFSGLTEVAGATSASTGASAASARFIDNVVRAGVNYHFGAPVVAKY